MQAVTWIKKREGQKLDGKMKRSTTPLLKQLELWYSTGYRFCLRTSTSTSIRSSTRFWKNITVNPMRRKTIKLGDKEVDWDVFQLSCAPSCPPTTAQTSPARQ